MAKLAAVRTELGELRFTGHSTSSRVACTVDGEGTVLELRIEPGSLRRIRPKQLAGEIKESIDAARTAQFEVASRRYRRMLTGAEGFDVGTG